MQRIRLLLLGLALSMPSQIVTASEFGNVFGSADVEAASRQASATALQAIENVISGIRSRELQESDGSDDFATAARLFDEAAGRMEEIVSSVSDQGLTDPQIAYLRGQFETGSEIVLLLQDARSLAAVYRLFAQRTRRMSETLFRLSSNQNAFSVLSPLLVEYFKLADAIVAVRGVQ